MNLSGIFHNSYIYFIISKICVVLKESITAKIFILIYNTFINAFNVSFTKQLFLTENSSFINFFNNSFLTNFFKNVIFKLVKVLILFFDSLFDGSFSQKVFNSLKRDLSFNSFKYTSIFLLCWTMVYVILELIFGAGFTREEMLLYILIVVFLFALSGLEIKTDKILKSSIIIKWIENLFN